jgi:hypothetical protein
MKKDEYAAAADAEFSGRSQSILRRSSAACAEPTLSPVKRRRPPRERSQLGLGA